MNKGKLAILAIILIVVMAAFLIRNQEELDAPYDSATPGITSESGEAANTSEPAVVGESAESGDSGRRSMNIEGLELSQGEEGKLQWTLVAKQADMAGQDGLIQAVEPYLTYYLTPADTLQDATPDISEVVLAQSVLDPENILTVLSRLGEVDQERDIMRFIEKVHVTNADKTLLSQLLEYSGGKRQLVSPGHADFSARGMDGEANRVVWNLDENVLYAYGDVRVDWENVSRPERPVPGIVPPEAAAQSGIEPANAD
ncbi:MAG: hypothetical protein LBV80_04520 [Deltaproteobacteria bacterium]|jgi:hypothetical protein|nr:hypothetical protein [Deltaproteobacteria bacterium]